MGTTTVIINEAPYGKERAWNALRFAAASISGAVKMDVNIFLLEDGVSVARRGQNPPKGYYNLEKMLEELIEDGVRVKVCGTCAKARGLSQEDLVAGVEIGTMIDLANWVKESSNVVSF